MNNDQNGDDSRLEGGPIEWQEEPDRSVPALDLKWALGLSRRFTVQGSIIAALVNEVRVLFERIERLRAGIEVLERARSECAKMLQSARVEVDSLIAQKQELSRKVEQMRADVEAANDRRDAALKNNRELRAELDQMRADADLARARHADHECICTKRDRTGASPEEAEIERLGADVHRLTMLLETARGVAADRLMIAQKYADEIDTLDKKLVEKESLVAMLRDRLSNAQNLARQVVGATDPNYKNIHAGE